MLAHLSNLLVTHAVCTVVVYLVVKLSNFYGADMTHHPPEDKVLGKLPAVPEDIKRRARIIANNNENIPVELALFWAGFISVFVQTLGGGGKEEALALNVLFPIYTAARLGYCVTYACSMQPARTIFFTFSMLAALAAAGVLLSSASKAYTL